MATYTKPKDMTLREFMQKIYAWEPNFEFLKEIPKKPWWFRPHEYTKYRGFCSRLGCCQQPNKPGYDLHCRRW